MRSKNLLLELLNKDSNANKDIFDYLQYDLNKKIYSFGLHFKNPFEKYSLYQNIQLFLFEKVSKFLTLYYSFKNRNSNTDVILSSAYFNISGSFSDDYKVACPPWIFKRNQVCLEYNLYSKSLEISKLLNKEFKHLLTDDFFKLVKHYKILLKEYIVKYNVKGLFLPQDIGFFEKLAIDVFKELKIPTFNFIHGLPGVYNIKDYNRTDYLVVWGDEIKENFVKIGYNADKIIVNGHPKYQNIELHEDLKFSLDDILVLTKSLNGSQYTDSLIIGDRSNLIYYLLSIQQILQKFGVKSVRLRPHPSENIDWYFNYLDTHFFKKDDSDITTSLKKSTLVIGGTSTVFLESILSGVNYLVYEPVLEDQKLLDGFFAIPPFDGLNKKVPVAKNQLELEQFLLNKSKVDPTIINQYINSTFDSNLVLNKIKNHNEIIQ
jgi:hypothetical protein